MPVEITVQIPDHLAGFLHGMSDDQIAFQMVTVLDYMLTLRMLEYPKMGVEKDISIVKEQIGSMNMRFISEVTSMKMLLKEQGELLSKIEKNGVRFTGKSSNSNNDINIELSDMSDEVFEYHAVSDISDYQNDYLK